MLTFFEQCRRCSQLFPAGVTLPPMVIRLRPYTRYMIYHDFSSPILYRIFCSEARPGEGPVRVRSVRHR